MEAITDLAKAQLAHGTAKKRAPVSPVSWRVCPACGWDVTKHGDTHKASFWNCPHSRRPPMPNFLAYPETGFKEGTPNAAA